MKHITFYLDFISPYAWLAFERLPEVLEGLSYTVTYRPVLLGALLQQHANPGPAGIAPKRDWTYRHVTWLGHAQGTPLQMPARHPFNPLPLLRQALACSEDGRINRYVAGTVLRHVWVGGQDALDPERLATLNAIVHPLVGARSAELEGAARPGDVVIHDVPLLTENGLAPLYDLVVVVDASPETQLDRLVRLRGMAADEARARMAAQARAR